MNSQLDDGVDLGVLVLHPVGGEALVQPAHLPGDGLQAEPGPHGGHHLQAILSNFSFFQTFSRNKSK